MTTTLAVILFILGLIIGSFLNVVVFRMNIGKPLRRSLGGRSACLSCRNGLCWYELIPLFSFCGLKGRCKNCKTKISLQYPLVELATGLVFALVFLKLFTRSGYNLSFLPTSQFFTPFIFYVVMFCLLIVVAAYDSRHKIIPDKLSFTFGALAFAGLFLFSNFSFAPHVPGGLELLSGVLLSLPFALLWLVSRGAWMGFGDAKLALGLGWFLGLSLGLSAVVLAFWIGALVGLFLLMSSKINQRGKRFGMKSEMPFAFYLALGAFLAFICEFYFFPLYV